MPATSRDPPALKFFTSHAAVLAAIAADPGTRMRDVAARIGLTERAVQRLVAGLAAAGYLGAERVGRRNRYTVHRAAQRPDGPAACRTVADLLRSWRVGPATG